jgi:hypothetical protein
MQHSGYDLPQPSFHSQLRKGSPDPYAGESEKTTFGIDVAYLAELDSYDKQDCEYRQQGNDDQP